MLLVAILHGWFWHPLAGVGYQFWSGIGSDAGELSIAAAVYVWIRSRNCHVGGCWRLNWHEHPEHGHPVCRHHHPDRDRVRSTGLDRGDILDPMNRR